MGRCIWGEMDGLGVKGWKNESEGGWIGGWWVVSGWLDFWMDRRTEG